MAKRIEVSGLHAYYGGVHAIEDISMTVEPQPDGPMNAVTERGSTVIEMSSMAWTPP